MKTFFLTGASGFIGTNLIAELKRRGYKVCNYDAAEPACDDDKGVWVRGDIMDAEDLKRAMMDFSPDVVIHLAARTDCDEETTVEAGYQVNTLGTTNLLEAVKECPSVIRLIVTSSQYVCGPGRQPADDHDYFPHTIYGQSKVEVEKLTREIDPPCVWTLIRPVNIWGPFHERYAKEFWKIAAAGLYFHPNVTAPTRSYGYVENIIWQMIGLLDAPANKVHREVFYVGDHPIQIDRWSIGFCRALRGKDPLRIPLWLIKKLALVGDAISFVIRRPFFITTSRLESMTQDYLSPIDKTEALLGRAPTSLEDGIKETAKWFRTR